MVQRLIRKDSSHIAHSHPLVFLPDVFRHNLNINVRNNGTSYVSGPPPPPSPPHSPPNLTTSKALAGRSSFLCWQFCFYTEEKKKFFNVGKQIKAAARPTGTEKKAICFQHFGPPPPTLQPKVTVAYVMPHQVREPCRMTETPSK